MRRNSSSEPAYSLLAVFASPRKRSNSTAIAESLLSGFEDAAGSVARSDGASPAAQASQASRRDGKAQGGKAPEVEARTSAELQRFSLRELKIGPCLGCDECKKSPEARCVQEDDMQRIYPVLERADTLLLATPVYSFNLSAQIKIFIDRMYALWNEGGLDRLQGKRIVLILTYGDEDVFASGGVNAIRSIQDLSRFYGMEPPEVIHCRAGDEGEAELNAEIIERAARAGRRLATAQEF